LSRPFVRLGDKTTHGGTVISGDPTFDIHGKAVARVGDLTVCPRCKGTFAINSGLKGMVSMEQSPACHMDATACGAKLLSSLADAFGDDSQESASGASVGDVAAVAPNICLDCLAKAAAGGAAMVVRE
jgi:uncharacterized Zn-binding protein involved in type VI secretion